MSQPAQKPAPTAAPTAAPAAAAAPTAAKPAQPAAPAPTRLGVPPGRTPAGPSTLRLKKGQMLFNEGDSSRSMYFLKVGMIRIFKKKGDAAAIEIDTIRSGQILGELAFLDGNPRSASGEALTECELTEVSGATFQSVLGTMPDWLKLLLKTVVGRLRTASTRIRQLEAASTAFDYSDKDSKRGYVYMSPPDVLKLCASILLVAARNGVPGAKGIEVKESTLQRYGNQIIGVPSAKLTTMMDILTQVGVMSMDPTDPLNAFVNDMDTLEKFISYLNEENMLEPSKRHDISVRGFMIMSYMAKHIASYPANAEGKSQVNLADIRAKEAAANGGKEPFRMDEFPELVKIGYGTQADIKNTNEVYTTVVTKDFIHSYKMQRIIMSIHKVNEEKRKGGK